jgi:predicted transcriptional regulator
MSDASINQLTADIVSAYARGHHLNADQVVTLISTVHQALSGVGKPTQEVTEKTPAVPIRRSVTADYVVCLECGWRGKVLRRHLSSRHGLSPDEYRSSWKLRSQHPLTAPGYSERRSRLAKELGLGRGRAGKRTSRPATRSRRASGEQRAARKTSEAVKSAARRRRTG